MGLDKPMRRQAMRLNDLSPLLIYSPRDWLRLAALALLYALLAKISLVFATVGDHITLVWLPSGLALAALLLGGKRYWPGVFVGAGIAPMLAGLSLPVSAGIALGNTLEPLLGAWLLSRGSRFDPSLTRYRDFLRLLFLGGIISPSVSALGGISILFITGTLTQSMLPNALLTWWMGDMLGIIIVAPTILVWRRRPQDWWVGRRKLELAALLGLGFFSGQVIFLDWFHDALGLYAQAFLMFIWIAWGALRFGSHGVLLLLCMTLAQALLGITKGVGYFGNDLVETSMFSFWSYFAELTAVGMTLSLVLSELRQGAAGLRTQKDFLRAILETEPECVKIVDPKGNLLEMNAAGLAMLEATSLDEVKRCTIFGFILPQYCDAFRALHKRVLQGESGTLEFEVLGLRGTRRWLETRAAPMRDASGKVTCLLGITRDITARKKAEAEVSERERQLSTLIGNLPGVAYRCRNNADYTMEFISDGIEKMAGYPADDFMHQRRQFGSLIHPDDQERVWVEIQTALQKNQPYELTYRLLTASGAEKWLWERGRGIYDNHGQLLALEGFLTDITERKQAEDHMRLAASIYESSTEAIMVTDENNRIIDINPAFVRITGYTLAEVVGKGPEILQSGRHDESFYREMWRGILNDGHWQGEIWDRRKDGEVYAKWMNISVIRHPDGRIHRHVAQFSDITEKKRKDELIWTQANYDALTGLPNRRLLQDRLEQHLIKARRTGSPLALLFIDLDRFKEINDTLGHAKGDVMLVEAARRIRECVRESDTVARLGGDEFTVILAEFSGRPQIERITQHIIQELAHPFYFENDEMGYYISASIGISLYPDDATDLEGLLKHADQALYVAKAEGRSRSSYFTPSMQREAIEKLALTNDLRQALAKNELHVYYQPIVELASGRVVKAEALLRWQHPKRGMISPAIFIPLAEESGVIVEIGEWVFQQAIASVARWRKQFGRVIQVSVNKSPVQFEQPAKRPWSDWLTSLHLPGNSVTVEITEGLLLKASPKVEQRLLEFRNSGIEVSIDDFGTGFSSLAYLNQFDIDYLKIDRSFISNLTEDESSKALTEAIIVMAHKLGIRTVAEGVETEQQRDLLVRFGCDFAQGFLYSHAVPCEEFEALLACSQG